MKWQPIETAPRNGTEIILTCGEAVWTGYWENQANYWGEVGFQDEDGRQGHYFHRHPSPATHWMPLPEPPEE